MAGTVPPRILGLPATTEEVHVSEPAAADPEPKSRFTLPSAYTILFALIVLTAIATWIIPAGAYNLNAKGGARSPGRTTRCQRIRRASSSTR